MSEKKDEINFYKHCFPHLGCNLYDFSIVEHLESKSSPVYRFFKNKKYAEDFANGIIRISTLNACRILENKDARDPSEGNLLKYISEIHINNPNDEKYDDFFQQLNYRSKGRKLNFEKISIINSIFGQAKLDDGFVLCTSNKVTKYLKNKFGTQIVKIHYPNLFAYYIFLELRRKVNVFMFKAEQVKYGKQSIDITKSKVYEEIGFLKNDRFKKENEFRMLYHNNKNNLSPLIIEIPELKYFCEYLK